MAHLVWERFGDVPNFCEPFAGSLAVLLGRPHEPRIETVNDINGFITNGWRAIKHAPDEVAQWADQPVFENNLHAIHIWLVERKDELVSQLEGDIDYYDARAAGYWIWGVSSWLGGGWCDGKGPWQAMEHRLMHSTIGEYGIKRRLMSLGGRYTKGIGINSPTQRGRTHLWMRELAERLRYVRIASGDWSRICGPTPTYLQGLTGVFLDPPYSGGIGRDEHIYSNEDYAVAKESAAWALSNGDNPLMRIAICGYEGEHEFPESWECVAWKANGGFGNRSGNNVNASRERIWFSPHCLKPQNQQMRLL